MWAYVGRRFMMLIPVFLGVTLITFILMNIIPGDPVALLGDPKSGEMDQEVINRIRAQWGLDRPLHIRYLMFLRNAVEGDLGFSYRTNEDVTKTVLEHFPATLRLSFAAMLVAVTLGVTAGVLASVKRGSIFDTLSMLGALFGISTPVFWLGLMLMWLVGVKWPILPPSGYGPELKYLVLPSITLGLAVSGIIARMTRSSMLNVIRLDFITTARAKGLSERVIVYKHALKNALIPVITVVGVQTSFLLGGAVITETVFTWPGLGRLLVDSINQRDLPVVQGSLLFISMIFVLVNLLVDLTYAYLDPRIRYQ